jgi:guanylate kinase
MSKRGSLIVVTGPSGAGKGTVLKKVLAALPDVYYSVSATTRAPREGEQNGVHYHFLTREQFETLIAQDRLLEHAEYAGNYYGTPADPADEQLARGGDVLLEIELQGALQIRKKRPEALMVFLAPPSFAELERRLRGRGTESEEKIERRLAIARRECASLGEFEYVVVNDDPDAAAERLCCIIRAARCRTCCAGIRVE